MENFTLDDCKLCLTNTDSLLYNIPSKQEIRDQLFSEDMHFFDTSNYPRDYKYFSNDWKKVVDKFQNECGGEEMSEFIGLRAKMCSFKLGFEETKKQRG